MGLMKTFTKVAPLAKIARKVDPLAKTSPGRDSSAPTKPMKVTGGKLPASPTGSAGARSGVGRLRQNTTGGRRIPGQLK